MQTIYLVKEQKKYIIGGVHCKQSKLSQRCLSKLALKAYLHLHILQRNRSHLFCLVSDIITVVLLPVREILAVIFYNEKIQAEKRVYLALSLWRFGSYLYSELNVSYLLVVRGLEAAKLTLVQSNKPALRSSMAPGPYSYSMNEGWHARVKLKFQKWRHRKLWEMAFGFQNEAWMTFLYEHWCFARNVELNLSWKIRVPNNP